MTELFNGGYAPQSRATRRTTPPATIRPTTSPQGSPASSTATTRSRWQRPPTSTSPRPARPDAPPATSSRHSSRRPSRRATRGSSTTQPPRTGRGTTPTTGTTATSLASQHRECDGAGGAGGQRASRINRTAYLHRRVTANPQLLKLAVSLKRVPSSRVYGRWSDCVHVFVPRVCAPTPVSSQPAERMDTRRAERPVVPRHGPPHGDRACRRSGLLTIAAGARRPVRTDRELQRIPVSIVKSISSE